jgi:large subunit ribosomal protein L23
MALLDFMKKREKEEKQKRTRKSEAADSSTSEIKTEAAVQIDEHHEGMSLIAPHITEKSRDMSHKGGYIFEVRDDATKATVKDSVERMYKVHVMDVRMITMPGKPRRRGLTKGLKKGYKKAVVRLKSGESIDLF